VLLVLLQRLTSRGGFSRWGVLGTTFWVGALTLGLVFQLKLSLGFGNLSNSAAAGVMLWYSLNFCSCQFLCFSACVLKLWDF